MRFLAVGLTIVCLLGCGDFNEAMQSQRKPVTLPGLASPEDMDALQQGHAATKGNANRPKPAVGNQGQGRSSIIGRKTREILNAKEQIKKQNVVIVKRKGSGNDPFTVATNVYTYAASFTGSLGIQQWIRHEKALNGKFPTYQKLQTWMKKNPGVELPVLPARRMYGYDEDTGSIVVLEVRKN